MLTIIRSISPTFPVPMSLPELNIRKLSSKVLIGQCPLLKTITSLSFLYVLHNGARARSQKCAPTTINNEDRRRKSKFDDRQRGSTPAIEVRWLTTRLNTGNRSSTIDNEARRLRSKVDDRKRGSTPEIVVRPCKSKFDYRQGSFAVFGFCFVLFCFFELLLRRKNV